MMNSSIGAECSLRRRALHPISVAAANFDPRNPRPVMKLHKESYANTYAALNVRNALDKLLNALQSPCGGRLERRPRHSSWSTRPTPRRDYTRDFAECHALAACLTKPAVASSAAQLATPRTTTTPRQIKPINVSQPAPPPVIPSKLKLATPTSPPVAPTPKLHPTSQLEPIGPPETGYSSAAAPVACSPAVECTTIDPKVRVFLPSRDGSESSNRACSVDSGLNPLRNPEQYQGFVTAPPYAGSKLHSNPDLNLSSDRGGKRPCSRSSLTSEVSELSAESACHVPPHLQDQIWKNGLRSPRAGPCKASPTPTTPASALHRPMAGAAMAWSSAPCKSWTSPLGAVYPWRTL